MEADDSVPRQRRLDVCQPGENRTFELLTRKDVARIFKVSILSVIRWEAVGKLMAVRLGAGTVRYQRSAVEKLIADSITKGKV